MKNIWTQHSISSTFTLSWFKMEFGPAKKKIPVFAMKDNKHRSRMETPAPWRQVDMFIFNHYCIFVNSPSSNLISTYIWYVVVVVLTDASFLMAVTRWWTFLNVISQNEMQKVWNSWNSFGHIFFYKGLWQKVQTPSKWQWQLQFRFELIKFYWKQEEPHSFDMCTSTQVN